MKNKSPIKAFSADSASPVADLSVIGTYEGECANADITNENGMDIPREVWSTVFSSDLYKKALKHGWYIGFLGHPEDPNCMDFRNACIVMREGRLDDNGKVYGKFDLINTPVGQVVKAFQDAGVIFGISVRGAGDVINNSVDPETFIFRGFDLVTFPAFPDAIPTFSAVAASTKLEDQVKYKSVCSAVKKNLSAIKSASAIDVIQSQFAPQSDEYAALEARKRELQSVQDINKDDTVEDITAEKLRCMTNLYLEQVEANSSLAKEAETLRVLLATTERDHSRKIRAVERITASQMANVERSYVSASAKLNTKLQSSTANNLKYKQEIEASASEIAKKDSIISSLRSELDETVRESADSEARASNLDESNQKLRKQLAEKQAIVDEYQNAYAALYASAIGASLENVKVTANTRVDELKRIIGSHVSNANVSNVFTQPAELEIVEDDESSSDDSLITI